jgi:Ca2+-binding RTX toxin-like protein
MRCHRLLAGVALVWMLLAQSALGATVGVSLTDFGSQQLLYNAALGEVNDVRIVEAPGGVFTITDLNAAITPLTPECMSISPNAVRCTTDPEAFDPVDVQVRSSDGADRVDVATNQASVYGGLGADTLSGSGIVHVSLYGGEGDDHLRGGSRSQTLRGGAGEDSLAGGPDNDELVGGTGADIMAGGSGLDSALYADHREQVSISLDDRANDGAPGEGDWLRGDIEGAVGSLGTTTFIGNAGPNFFNGRSHRDLIRGGAGRDGLFGGGGADLISGGGGEDFVLAQGGNDVILGGAGGDRLEGGTGADRLRGGRGDDLVFAGPGNDILRAGVGKDRLVGNSGDDVLYARDRNRDRVSGRPGHDRAHVDRIDVLVGVEEIF